MSDAPLCRECGRNLPEKPVEIKITANVGPGRRVEDLVGFYCSSNHALIAFRRGRPNYDS